MPSLPLASTSVKLEPAALPDAEIEGLYVHIPFCFHKCHYCDFYSITRQEQSRMDRFVGLLLREWELWAVPDRRPINPRTIFFGGGTPSLLPLDSMRRLLKALRERMDFSSVKEFTIECNPATVSSEYCRMLRESGVDRLSFGAQSFDRQELQALERHHDPDDVFRSVQIARAAGFERINLDLIYAIPGQNLISWQHSLEEAIKLDLRHYSCYGLTYEPNTPLAVKKRLGRVLATADEIELEMLRHIRQRLRRVGRPPYEISNYALPGQECLHNLMYWTGGNYLGLGPSAASHIDGHRFRNRPHLGEWEKSIESGELPATDIEALTPRRRAGELAMLMLRLTRGLNYSDFAARLGSDAAFLFREVIDRISGIGLIVEDDSGVRLTEQGICVADAVASEFLAAAQ
jgi:oxygen-independent coproporphyrinogen-3 oxidase